MVARAWPYKPLPSAALRADRHQNVHAGVIFHAESIFDVIFHFWGPIGVQTQISLPFIMKTQATACGFDYPLQTIFHHQFISFSCFIFFISEFLSNTYHPLIIYVWKPFACVNEKHWVRQTFLPVKSC